MMCTVLRLTPQVIYLCKFEPSFWQKIWYNFWTEFYAKLRGTKNYSIVSGHKSSPYSFDSFLRERNSIVQVRFAAHCMEMSLSTRFVQFTNLRYIRHTYVNMD